MNQFDVMVGTYRDYSTYDARPHSFLDANGRTITLNDGETFTLNQMSPKRAVVAFPDKPEFVVLDYPTTQTAPTMVNDAHHPVLIN